MILGTVLALLPAFLVSLSEGLQGWNDRGWGLHDWRDTLLVQVGWAFILYGPPVVLWSLATRRRPDGKNSSRWLKPFLVVALALGLSAPAVLALGANTRYAESRRDRPLTNIVNLISAASVDSTTRPRVKPGVAHCWPTTASWCATAAGTADPG